ncbi:hypothetical protein BJ944DRAFT_269788 [Cunninghamella echinulata]|nr:hypothetical protein BJ944DRAFT_269788 [Cunninghamella echinulata]
MLSHLPFEIIEIINQELTNADKYQCLLTCRAWYSLFKFMLYQQCKINSRKSFMAYYNTLEKDKQLCGQVKKLDVSQCEISEQEHQYILQACPKLKDYSLRWDPSIFLHDYSFLDNNNNGTTTNNIYDHQKFSQVVHYQTMCNQTNFPVWPVNTNSSDAEHFRFSKNAYLSNLTLHDATIVGLLNIIQQLPFLKQLDLRSLKLDITIHDVELIHLTCPQLTSLSFDIHTLLSSPSSSSTTTSSTFVMDWPPSLSMKHLKLVYKHLEKPGKTPWIHYIRQKYPYLTTLEMQTKYTRRKNYWQWNGNNLDGDQPQQQQAMLDHMDDHPDFRLALQNWAESSYYLTSIHFSGIPWDQWFFQHLPKLNTKINQTIPTIAAPRSFIKKIHVARTNDNMNTASAIFWTLINHGSMIHLTNLNIQPVAIQPDIHFYEALNKLKSLEELTIQKQGICSNKQLLCQLDMHSLLNHCRQLKKLNLGGLELTPWQQNQNINNHLQLEHLSLSTTRVNHYTLQQIIQFCPHLIKFYFISCEYDALMEYDIPTLEIGNTKQKWKEIHINYPFIQSSYQHNLQPIGLSGRRQCESPRFMTTKIYHCHDQRQEQQEEEKWFHLLPITNYYYFNRHQSNITQQLIPSHQVEPILNTDQKNLSLRKEGLEFGRIKIIASSISNLFINGTQIIL